jgi:DNA polymerase-3 subunit gamma/tau
MARILAKALNCDHGPTAEPCLKCPSCREIAQGNALDLVEIDAASNRRIDDIRELRENVRYRPVRDRHKVFIIDEAHQITSDAFNALLKTLEEPPEWVVFVLCTTEPHEIPPTITSRCQSFPFRAVEVDQVVERMRWICKQEGIAADTDSLVALALAGDGSIRDSLSALDQAIACFGNRLEAATVRDLLGAIPTEVTDEIVEALRKGDAATMLAIVDRVLQEGRHAQHFCGELARYFRNLLVMKVSGSGTRLVTIGPKERNRLEQQLQHFVTEDLTRYLQLLLQLYRDLQQAAQPRFRLELGLLKLVYAGHLRPIEELLKTFQDGGAGGGAGVPGATAQAPTAPPRSAAAAVGGGGPSFADRGLSNAGPPPPAAEPSPPRLGLPAAATEPPAPELRSAGSGDLQERLLAALLGRGDEHLADAIEHGEVRETAQGVEIRSHEDYLTGLRLDVETLREALQQILGREVVVLLGDPARTEQPTPANGPAVTRKPVIPGTEDELTRRVLADPEVQKYQKLFSGRVREVRNLRGYPS